MPGRSHLAVVFVALATMTVASVSGCRLSPRKTKKQAQAGRSLLDVDSKRRAAAAPEVEEEEEAEPLGYVHAKARFVWIRKKPDAESDWLGYITLGQTLPLRRDPRGIVEGNGCRSWVPVEPKGWVCEGRDATLEADDPTFRLMQERTADIDSPWPFDYARSLGAPRYRVLPTLRDQKAKEGDIPALLAKIEKARTARGDFEIEAIDKRLVGVELTLSEQPVPPLFEPPPPVMETDADIEIGSTIAYVREFDHDGRSWLLGWDAAITPQNRVKKYPRSAFHGIELDEDVELPIAFVKRQGAYKYRATNGETPVLTAEMFDPHSMIELGEGSVEVEGRKLYATEEAGVFVSEKDIAYVNPTGVMPKGVSDTGRRTWIEVSTVGGWLVAYEGARAVYATAISAGRAALNPDGTMVPSSSTPVGTWTIKSKLKTATMRSDRRPNRTHAEVMYTQVFHEDYALHGAYWHDDFGDRRSAGCVNLAPIDAKWVFGWTDPPMPDGWHAKKVTGEDSPTIVVVHY